MKTLIFTQVAHNETECMVNDRRFNILGDSKDDYYSVYGATKQEIQEHQHKLYSFVPSKLNDGRFKKLKDAKQFIKLVIGEM